MQPSSFLHSVHIPAVNGLSLLVGLWNAGVYFGSYADVVSRAGGRCVLYSVAFAREMFQVSRFVVINAIDKMYNDEYLD